MCCITFVFFLTAEPHNKLNIPTISNIPTVQANISYTDEEGKVAAIAVIPHSVLFLSITILIIAIYGCFSGKEKPNHVVLSGNLHRSYSTTMCEADSYSPSLYQ